MTTNWPALDGVCLEDQAFVISFIAQGLAEEPAIDTGKPSSSTKEQRGLASGLFVDREYEIWHALVFGKLKP